ncbi:DUF3040 domain-containing protein [Actinomadura miaoliensis]
MGLPGDERAVLRRIDADLERDDPDLARRLRTFSRTDVDAAETAVSWRPPRVAVAVAASVAAVAVFLVAVVVLATRPPCSPPTGAATADERAHGQRSAALSGARPC